MQMQPLLECEHGRNLWMKNPPTCKLLMTTLATNGVSVYSASERDSEIRQWGGKKSVNWGVSVLALWCRGIAPGSSVIKHQHDFYENHFTRIRWYLISGGDASTTESGYKGRNGERAPFVGTRSRLDANLLSHLSDGHTSKAKPHRAKFSGLAFEGGACHRSRAETRAAWRRQSNSQQRSWSECVYVPATISATRLGRNIEMLAVSTSGSHCYPLGVGRICLRRTLLVFRL